MVRVDDCGAPLDISVTPTGPRGVRVAVVGEVDSVRAAQLQTRLWWVLTEFEPDALEVDLAGVSFLGSAGRAALVSCWDDARRKGCQLTLARPRAAVHLLLEFTGLAGLFGLDGEPSGDLGQVLPLQG